MACGRCGKRAAVKKSAPRKKTTIKIKSSGNSRKSK